MVFLGAEKVIDDLFDFLTPEAADDAHFDVVRIHDRRVAALEGFELEFVGIAFVDEHRHGVDECAAHVEDHVEHERDLLLHLEAVPPGGGDWHWRCDDAVVVAFHLLSRGDLSIVRSMQLLIECLNLIAEFWGIYHGIYSTEIWADINHRIYS